MASTNPSSSSLPARISKEPAVNPLTIRSAHPITTVAPTKPTEKNHSLDDRRLYIGNLDPGIDEYMLLKLFSPFGKVTKLDFMFHYSGPKKGTPRGYCFLDYEAPTQAAMAIKQMNRRSIKNRALVVSLANLAPPSTDQEGRKKSHDPNRPTNFSLLKAGALKNASTNERIKAMERKLAQMAETPNKSASTPTSVHSSLPTRPSSGNGVTRGPGPGSRTTTTTGSSTHRGAGAGVNSSVRQRPY
ncbi:hypothetical protein BGX24_010721 [Mortierella sp. AD032]|nr:hypothetical protein BGX24_010721 [Mortierella sp. AD032]